MITWKIPLVGVEPTISRLEGGCLVHLATEALVNMITQKAGFYGVLAIKLTTAMR